MKPQHAQVIQRIAEVVAKAMVRIQKMSVPCTTPQVTIHKSVMTPLAIYNGGTHRLYVREDWLDRDPSHAEIRQPILDAMASFALAMDHKKRLDLHTKANVPNQVQKPQLAGYKSAKWRYYYDILVKSC